MFEKLNEGMEFKRATSQLCPNSTSAMRIQKICVS